MLYENILNTNKEELVDLIKKETNDKINDEAINEFIKMANVHLKLNKHNHKVWTGKNGRTLTYIDTPDGKRKLVSKKSDKDMAEYLSRLDYSLPKITNKGKTDTFLSLFLEIYQAKLKWGEIEKTSYDKYYNNFKRFFVNGFKNISEIPIDEIDEEQLEEFIKDTISHYGLSVKAFRDMKCIIREIFKRARKRNETEIAISVFLDELQINKKIFGKVKKKDEDYVFTAEEVEKLAEYVLSLENPDVRDFGVLLVFYTGLRCGELSALKWNDIGEEKIHVWKSEKRFKDDEGHYKYDVQESVKTEAAFREIPITKTARLLLERIRELNPDGKYIFQKPNGERYIGKAFTNKMKSLCGKVGINKRSIHKARATFSTNLINKGVDETVICYLLGHTNIQTTRQYYEYNNRTSEEARKQMEKALEY